ncbi:nanos homolog 2 [Protobothrops mucrosquamatus]|uniref:nanos homolog 2 n=1 Tax=Protobothrops mucrosquamatus TaxID=103944 RepID=UPI0010FB859E|nr:nanos homolog 2 [Protobothrops mucrosquamatus]
MYLSRQLRPAKHKVEALDGENVHPFIPELQDAFMSSPEGVPAVAQGRFFDQWKDYLNLSKVVMEIVEERKKPSPPSPWKDPLKGPRKRDPQPVQPTQQGICNFCKHNGESKKVYSSHTLKRADGVVVCPILRNYTCPLCGATADKAHTLKYCPHNKAKQSLYRRSGRNSAGRLIKR